jgi:hypothetical protein
MQAIFEDLKYVCLLQDFLTEIYTFGISNIEGFNEFVGRNFEDLFWRGRLKLLWGFLQRYHAQNPLSKTITGFGETPETPQNEIELRVLITKYRLLWNDISITEQIADDIFALRSLLLNIQPNSCEYLPMMVMWRDCFLKQQLISHYPKCIDEQLKFPHLKKSTGKRRPDEKHTPEMHDMETRLFDQIVNPSLNNSNSSVETSKLQRGYCEDILLAGETHQYAARPGKRFIVPKELLDVVRDNYPTGTTTHLVEVISQRQCDVFNAALKNGHLYNFMLFHIFDSFCSKECDFDFNEICVIQASDVYQNPDIILATFSSPRIYTFKNEFYVCLRDMIAPCQTAAQALVMWSVFVGLYCDWQYVALQHAAKFDLMFLDFFLQK